MSKRAQRRPGAGQPDDLSAAATSFACPAPAWQPPARILWQWLGIAAVCYGMLALYGGFLNGRAIWCDEIMHIVFQKMSLTDLLLCRNNQGGDCMPCFALFDWRPLASAFGYEVGGFLVSALAGALGLVFLVLTAHTLFGRRAALLALALGGVLPLSFYYASAISPYIVWAAANAALLLLVARWLVAPQAAMRGWGRVWLALAVFSVVGLHFGGVFSWGCLIAMASWLQYRAQPRGGRLRILLPFLLWNAVPALLCAPVYVQAQRVADKSAQLHVTLAQMWASLKALVPYVVDNAPAFAGGGLTCVGGIFLVAGVVALFRQPSRRSIAWLCLAVFAGSLTFRFVTGLHGYGIPAARHASASIFAALLLTTVGAAFLTDRARPMWIRVGGWGLLAVLLAVNALAIAGIVTMQGRNGPFKAITAFLSDLPSGRTVVSPNIYENRFLGGYYPIPRAGTIVSPCYWEEGAPARIEGLRRIWRLVPDAVLVRPSCGEEDVAAAGLSLPVKKEFPDSWLLRLSWRLRTFPEKLYRDTPVSYVAFHSADDLAARARREGHGLSVPGEGWKTVSFRSTRDGRVTFALLSPSPRAELQVFSPVARSAGLQLVLQPYARTTFAVDTGTNTVATFQVDAPPVQGIVVPTRQTFQGLVAPDMLVKAGINLGLSVSGVAVTVKDVPLQEGWNRLLIRNDRNLPFLLLAHHVVDASADTARAAP